MKYSGTTRTLSIVLAAIAAMSTMTSCDSKSDGGKQATAVVEAEEQPKNDGGREIRGRLPVGVGQHE